MTENLLIGMNAQKQQIQRERDQQQIFLCGFRVFLLLNDHHGHLKERIISKYISQAKILKSSSCMSRQIAYGDVKHNFFCQKYDILFLFKSNKKPKHQQKCVSNHNDHLEHYLTTDVGRMVQFYTKSLKRQTKFKCFSHTN